MGRTRQWLLLGLAGWLIVASVAWSGGVAEAAGPGGDKRALTEDAEGWLDAIMQLDVPGVVGRFERDGVGVTVASGVADVTKPGPVSSQARFRIGSATKTFVATVVLQLFEEGLLALDSPVRTWLPGLFAESDVTVRQILNQTSGLKDFDEFVSPSLKFRLLSGPPVSPRELVELAISHGYAFSPGARWNYSNTNYIVAGMIVEQITRTSLGEQLERRIFEPLGLDHSSFPTSTDISGGHARGYDITASGDYDDVTSIETSYAWAAGAIVASANDVSRFFRALLAGELFESEGALIEMMAMRDTNEEGKKYGLGLFGRDTQCGIVFGHDGSIPGYHSKSYHTGDGKRSATVLANMYLPEDPDAAVRSEVTDALCS